MLNVFRLELTREQENIQKLKNSMRETITNKEEILEPYNFTVIYVKEKKKIFRNHGSKHLPGSGLSSITNGNKSPGNYRIFANVTKLRHEKVLEKLGSFYKTSWKRENAYLRAQCSDYSNIQFCDLCLNFGIYVTIYLENGSSQICIIIIYF